MLIVRCATIFGICALAKVCFIFCICERK